MKADSGFSVEWVLYGVRASLKKRLHPGNRVECKTIRAAASVPVFSYWL